MSETTNLVFFKIQMAPFFYLEINEIVYYKMANYRHDYGNISKIAAK